MMPVAVVPGKTRCFQRQHGSYSAGANRSQKPAEARTFDRSSAGAALILVDHDNALETESMSAFA